MKGIARSEILSRIDFPSFYLQHLPDLKPNGNNEASATCPFHEDSTPSLFVNLEKGVFNCFGCGEAGDAIQFLQKLHSIDSVTAMDRIREECGVPHENAQKISGVAPRFLRKEQIERLHGQLLADETFLNRVTQARGLALETIRHFKLGLQNGRILIPMEAEPDRWAWKEHKGNQSRGNKAMIYPMEALKADLPRIIIAEGELDALILNQHGFPAVSGTAGAGTWKREWNHLFEGRNVILSYDNDEPGKKGAVRVAENLRSFARTIKAINWPMEMNHEGLKDVTDYFVKMGKSKADFELLLDRAKELGPIMTEVQDIRFIQPQGFIVDDHGIKTSCINREGIVTWSPAVLTPVFITSRAIDVDTGTEEVELAFRRDMKMKRLWIPRRQMSDARKIVELADAGFPVSTENSKQVVKYLTAFEAANITFTPRILVARGTGWKEIGGKSIFLLDSRSSSTKKLSEENVTIEFVAEPGFERFVKALSPHGSFAKWKQAIEPALDYHLAQFALYASFAAPLLRILKAPNFLIDFWGSTSVGKTSVLELAASVWGNPHKETGGLVFSWDSTKVFLERMADFFCDIPIFPDDSQVVPDNVLRNILYMVANGVGRGRGSIVGIRHTPTWHTVCFSTGERPLVECTTYAGARARTIEIYGSPFPNCGGAFINTLKEGIRSNYGHAGPRFIAGLTSIVENEARFQELKISYQEYRRGFSDKARNEVGDRYSHYFAVVRTAADLAHKILGIDDDLLADAAIDVVFRNTISDNTGELDTAKRALDFLISWINGNEAFFSSNNRESYGLWVSGECVCIYPHKLKEILVKEGFSDRGTLKAWAERGWIQASNGHYTFQKRVRTTSGDGCPLSSSREDADGATRIQRLVVIPWKIFKQFSEM